MNTRCGYTVTVDGLRVVCAREKGHGGLHSDDADGHGCEGMAQAYFFGTANFDRPKYSAKASKKARIR